MDAELKEYLGQRFGATDQRFDAMDRRFDPVDQRCDAVDPRLEALDQKIDAMQSSVLQRMDEMAAALSRRIRDNRTEVLKALYSMEENLYVRTNAQDAIINGLQQRQASLESRLLEIEKRLHLPPAA